jgi:hypothetical protein
MSSKLTSLGLPTSIAHASKGFVAMMKTMAADDPVRVGTLEAYVHGFHGVFIIMACVSGFALCASLFVKAFNIDKSLESDFKLQVKVLSNGDLETGEGLKGNRGSGSTFEVSFSGSESN